MIEAFTLGKTKQTELVSLFDFVKHHPNNDFYLTRENQRLHIDSLERLRQLIKSSIFCQAYQHDGDYTGLILVWKGLGGTITRNYVKILVKSPTEADKLLTILNWNFHDELYMKISKDSPLLTVFRGKGFRFERGRGFQVLLKRNRFDPKIRHRGKDVDDSTTNRH